MPITVLIGTIYSLARMAQASEYTILRTGGLSPGRALSLLAGLGLLFSVLNFGVGDYLTPFAEKAQVLLRAQLSGGRAFGGNQAWLKERFTNAEGQTRSVSVNIGGIDAEGQLRDVRTFEFDGDGRLVAQALARQARVAADGAWTLTDLDLIRWPPPRGDAPRVTDERIPTLNVKSSLDPSVVAAAVLPLASMSTLELWRYGRHLNEQAQATQQVRLSFWKKALYPLSCLVMVALALPFAYMHARSGGISLKVFGGIMLGIGFVLLNNLAGHIGMLSGWTPWIVAAAPSLLFLLLSLGSFAWLVRYR
jgi:lipopolysaccharide export system permease protein